MVPNQKNDVCVPLILNQSEDVCLSAFTDLLQKQKGMFRCQVKGLRLGDSSFGIRSEKRLLVVQPVRLTL
eukprot:144411-Rhodomonas_salina.1